MTMTLIHCNLSDLPLNATHVVNSVVVPSYAPEWHQWLEEIGFIPGEQVTIMARGMLGGDPLVVRVGVSTFALRKCEAACVKVSALPRPADTYTSATGNAL